MNSKTSIPNLALWLVIAFSRVASASDQFFFQSLQPNQKLTGFTVRTQYVNQVGDGVGGRFVSDKYGFIVDLFSLESAPQAFYWIKTPPADDRGEPHTCEHLLLGKGNVGRLVAAQEEMLLGNSTAYTDQLVTCYHFNTVAGNEAFFTLFQSKLNAFLNPDFTDEEIRREVAHVGATEKTDGKLWIEEKGTVYTEMVSNYEKPWSYLWEPMDEMVFGPDHPCANISGGRPDAIRQMVPEDLWNFQKSTHILSNMGAIVSIPPGIDPKECLKRLAAILAECQKQPSPNSSPSIAVQNLPPPAPTAPPGTVVINNYPAETIDDPGDILFSWPADLEYGLEEEILLELFLGNLANGSSSNLYQIFFDSATRRIDLGAGYCFATTSRYPGHPIRIVLGDVEAARITPEVIDSIRTLIRNAIAEIAALKPGSEELKAFDNRALASLSQRKRRYAQILDTPPQFGFRGGPAGFWISHLEGLESLDKFKKSITLADVFDAVESKISADANSWSGPIDKWRLTKIELCVVAAKPDPTMIGKIAADKESRLSGYVEGFKKRFAVTDDQQALRLYKAEFDAATAALEKRAAAQPRMEFTSDPPLSLDPELKSSTKTIQSVRLDAFRFDNLTSATIGLALNLNALPDSLLVYAPILPSIITGVGLEIDGSKLSHRDVETRLREEVLGLDSYYSNSDATGRAELVVRGRGANQKESLRAIDWMRAGLFHPLLSEDNLSRIRDLVSQRLNGMRNRMKGGEEGWVDVPFNALRHQDNRRYLAADCFLTQTLLMQRLKWRLASPQDPIERASLQKFARDLLKNGLGKSRRELDSLLNSSASLPKGANARHTAEELLADMRATLASVPDESLALDWEYLIGSALFDFGYGAKYALRDLAASLASVAQQSGARMFLISNASDRLPIESKLAELAAKLGGKPSYSSLDQYPGVMSQAIAERGGNSQAVYFGLVNPSTRNGLIYFGSQFHEPYDSSPDGVLDALAGRLYGGGGAHSFFMQTWGAGLAYSNGVAYRDRWSGVRYYAERCPDAAETMKFVVSILDEAKLDPALLDYVVALAFGESNAPSTYEERGESFANDLADGITPEKIAAFRRAVLLVKKDPKALKGIWSRMEKVYGRVLGGYGAAKQAGEGNTFLLIGPEDQIVSMEGLIAAKEGMGRQVTRIYPRDFWIRQ